MSSPRVSGARFDRLVQQVREPAFWIGPDLKLVWVNRAWEALTGLRAADAVGLVCRPHGPNSDGDPAGIAASFFPPPEALAGQPSLARTLLVPPGGERLWRCVDYHPFHLATGELAGLLGLVHSAEQPSTAPESSAQRLRRELLEVRDRLLARLGTDALVGRGPRYRRLTDQVATAATSTGSVLIVGEAGTGKKLVARTIHQLSSNRQNPLFFLDCTALPPDVLDRTLFGTAPDANEPRATPRLTFPAGSTLVLGDVLDLPRDLQGRLVAYLNAEGRLIATTTGDPATALVAERLRADLYFALTTFVIHLSPLRERLDELPILCQHFLERANLRGGRQRHGLTDETLHALALYDWPGNLRELSRVIDEAHASGDTGSIEPDDLPLAVRGPYAGAYIPPPLPPPATLDDLLTQVERRLIETALQRVRQNKSRAADLLGISRPRLYRRIKELNIPEEPEPAGETSVAAHPIPEAG